MQVFTCGEKALTHLNVNTVLEFGVCIIEMGGGARQKECHGHVCGEKNSM